MGDRGAPVRCAAMARRGVSSLASTLKFTATRVTGTAAAATARFVARHRRRPLRPGAFTVVAVNWKTAEFHVDLLRALEKFSPGVDVVIVDNSSSDASRDILRRAPVRSVLLPII